MSLMHYLNLVDSKLKTLSRLQKVELYLLPFIVTALIIVNSIELKSQALLKPNMVVEKNSVNAYEFLKHLEEFALKNKLELLNIKQDETIFNLEIKGKFSNILKTIYFCETFESVNDIDSLKLYFTTDATHLQIYFKLSDYKYDFSEVEDSFALNRPVVVLKPKKIVKKEQEIKPIVKKESKELKAVQQHFEINAIVNNEVLINNQWKKENERILGHRILKIEQHYITILNEIEGKEIVLKLIKG